ncbi:MAG: N-acetyltransferase family protein [Chloroflexota bacterium]
MNIRLADPATDSARVAQIYAPAVVGSTTSFEEIVPDAAEMAKRMRAVLARTPWLVADVDGGVVGYAYASSHRERAAYRWSVDISVYVDPAHLGQGIGRALYEALLPVLRRQRFVNVYAGIGLPNPASVALHGKIGMTRIAVYERVGWKMGRWVDVAWYGLRLSEPTGSPPPEPIPLPDLRDPI